MIGGPILLGVFAGAGPVAAYQSMAIIMGVIASIFLYVAVFAVDEKRFSSGTTEHGSTACFRIQDTHQQSFLVFLGANMCSGMFSTPSALRSCTLHRHL